MNWVSNFVRENWRNLKSFLHRFVPGLDDWNEVRAALKIGTIDVAFYLGPIGATTIEGIVEDKSTVLLSIGEIQQALVTHLGYSVSPVEFPVNAYSAEKLPLKSANPQGTVGFCAEALRTVALRKFLVCSSALGNDDGYLIATAAYEKLSSDSPLIGDWDAPPPLVEKPPTATPTAYSKNSGAKMRGKDISSWWQPETWPPGLTSAIGTLVMLLMTDLLGRWSQPPGTPPASGAGHVAQNTADTAETAAALATVAAEEAALQQLLKDLESRSEPLTPEDWARCKGEFCRLRQQARDLKEQSQLTADQDDKFKSMLWNIRAELDDLQPTSTAPAASARVT